MATVEDADKASGTRKALNIVAGIIGAGVGVYAGINLLIPLGLTAAVWWAGKKWLPSPKQLYVPAIAVQTGHLLWLSLGLLYVGDFGLDLLDVVVLVIGLTWLVLKPGLGPVLLLTAFQVLAFAVNAVSFVEVTIGSNPHKALLVHMVWRLMALFFMWHAYVQSRKVVRVEPATTGF
jgi:hypothetical protein